MIFTIKFYSVASTRIPYKCTKHVVCLTKVRGVTNLFILLLHEKCSSFSSKINHLKTVVRYNVSIVLNHFQYDVGDFLLMLT